MSVWRVEPVNLEFRALLKTPAVTGEDTKMSEAVLRILGFRESDARKSVAQHYGLLTVQRAGFLVRASSFKGLLRVASEYVVELKSLNLGLGHAVCSFLDVDGIGMPKCVLPLPTEDKLRRVLERERWVVFDRDRVEFVNYPCVPCSIFGATGLRSMVSVSFGGSFAREMKPRSYRRLFFNEVMRGELQGERLRPLLLYALEAGGEIALNVKLTGGGPQGLRSKSCPPHTLAAATLWLAVQLVNSGFFRLGRFKSRGLGVLQIMPSDATLGVLARLLAAEPDVNEITKRANEVLESELKVRLMKTKT